MNTRKELESEIQNNRFSKHFFNHSSVPVFTPLVYSINFFKDVFGKTIAAEFIYQYLRTKGPGSWQFDVNLPTVEWYINANVAGNQSYDTPAFGFSTHHYSGGAFSLIPAVWNYAWRNIGKLVGAAVLVPILPFTIGYALVRAAYDYAEEAYTINKESALLPQENNNVEACQQKSPLAENTTSQIIESLGDANGKLVLNDALHTEGYLNHISPENKFNEFCDDVTKMCEGLASPIHRDQVNRTSDGCDFILSLGGFGDNLHRTALASEIWKAFEPAAHEVKTKYWSIVTFKVSDLKESHPLFSSEGRKIAHCNIFDHLHGDVMNESGRLGKSLDIVSSSTGNSTDYIKKIIENKISSLRNEFDSKPSYLEKNKVILQLREFYNQIRDTSSLRNLVNAVTLPEESDVGIDQQLSF